MVLGGPLRVSVGTQTGSEIYECQEYSQGDHDVARLHIENGIENEFDPDIIELVKAGYKAAYKIGY